MSGITTTDTTTWYDESNSIGKKLFVNFTGAGVTATADGDTLDVTITSGGGSGTVTTLKESDSQVGGADIVTIDLGSGFDLTESPDTEINITLDISEFIAGLTNVVAVAGTDSIIIKDDTDGNIKKALLPAETGDIEGVTAQAPVTGGGTSGTVSVGVDTSSGGANLATQYYVDTNDSDTQLTEEQVEDFAGGMVSGNTETLITVIYQDADGTIDFVVDNDLSNYDNSTSKFQQDSDTTSVDATQYYHDTNDDDVPESGDFGNANDLDANGDVVNDSHDHTSSTVSDFVLLTADKDSTETQLESGDGRIDSASVGNVVISPTDGELKVNDNIELRTNGQLQLLNTNNTASHISIRNSGTSTSNLDLDMPNGANALQIDNDGDFTFNGEVYNDDVVRFKTDPWLDVTHPDYGAVPGDNASDVAGIQAAIDAAGNFGTIYFPPGRYVIDDTLEITGRGIKLIAAGAPGSPSSHDAQQDAVELVLRSGSWIFNYTAPSSFQDGPIFEKFSFKDSTRASTGGAVELSAGANVTFKRCSFGRWAAGYGVKINATSQILFDECNFDSNKVSVYATGNSNNIKIHNSVFNGRLIPNSVAVKADSAADIFKIAFNTFDDFDSTLVLTGSQNNIAFNEFEGDTNSIIINARTNDKGTVIIGNSFDDVSGGTNIIVGANARHVNIIGNYTRETTGKVTITDNTTKKVFIAQKDSIYTNSPAAFDSTLIINGVAYTWPTADGANNQTLHTDGAGTLTWEDDDTGAGSGAFSDAADPIVQNTTTKDVHIGDGAGTLTGKLEIGGDADQPQLVVEGHSTQTDDLIIAQLDNDTEVFSVSVSPSIFLLEVADAPVDKAGYGQFWVNTATPNEPYFTDDAGNDRALIWSGGAFHDGFSDFVANEHIDHTSITLTAGTLLSGGGDISANRTFNVDLTANASWTGIHTFGSVRTTWFDADTDTFNINPLGFSAASIAATGNRVFQLKDGGSELAYIDSTGAANFAGNVTAANLSGTNTGDDDVPEAGDYSNLTAGTALENNPTGTLNVVTNELTNVTYAATDTVMLADADDSGNIKKAVINHDNLTGFVVNEHVDHTSVTLTAGDGLGGGGDISANRTFTVNVHPDSSVALSADSLSIRVDDSSINIANNKLQVKDDGVALTTKTSGNYVASVGTNAPLSGGTGGSEGATLTLSADTSGTDDGTLATQYDIDQLDAGDIVSGTLAEARGGTGDTDLDDIVAGSAGLDVANGANTIIAGNATISLDVAPSSGSATLEEAEDALQVKYGTTLTESANGLDADTSGTDNHTLATQYDIDQLDASDIVSGTLAEARGGTGDTDLDDIVGTTGEITVTDGANSVIGGNVTLAFDGQIKSNKLDSVGVDGVYTISQFNAGTDPTADLEEETHASEHEDTGADEISVTAGMMNAGTGASASTLWHGDDTWSTIADDEIADGAVDGGSGGEIADGTVDANDLAANAVENAEMADDAVDEAEIADYAVTKDRIGFYTEPKTISFPDTLKSTGPDTVWLWMNWSGASWTTDSLHVRSDVDNYDISVVKADYNGGNAALVDAVQATTNGANDYFITETTITAGTITTGQKVGVALSADNADWVLIVPYWSW